jgi:hypothetical protein
MEILEGGKGLGISLNVSCVVPSPMVGIRPHTQAQLLPNEFQISERSVKNEDHQPHQ